VTSVASERLSTNGPRLVFIHGFTQTRESWRPIATRFADSHEVVLVDAPYHGESQDVDVAFESASNLISTVIDGGICIGYSMGGRLALLAALNQPAMVKALVLVSATPGIADPNERQTRREADDMLASEIERNGTNAFLKKWLAQPMFEHLQPTEADLQSRRDNSPHSLARSLRTCGTGNQESLWNRLAELTIPILIICGEDDRKFTEIAIRMNAALPQAQLEVIEGAGHSPHLEQPESFIARLEQWLAEVRG
jgi:2-succinyl-6-hydroxy-2,4-cyclohexadiene-1-carboxylate synthase